jgi:hypothetical protein
MNAAKHTSGFGERGVSKKGVILKYIGGVSRQSTKISGILITSGNF